MKLKKLIKIFSIGTIFFTVFHFFYKKEKIIVNENDIKQLEHLDIIVTNGQSFQSKLLNLLNFSYESYTHVGIICKVNNKIFVLHSTPDGTKENGIRYDDLQSFIDLSSVNFYKIIRGKRLFKKSILSINKDIDKYKSLKIPFDYEFDNFSKNKLYCSELVYDIYNNNGIIVSDVDLTKPIFPKLFTKMKEFSEILTRSYKQNKHNSP